MAQCTQDIDATVADGKVWRQVLTQSVLGNLSVQMAAWKVEGGAKPYCARHGRRPAGVTRHAMVVGDGREKAFPHFPERWPGRGGREGELGGQVGLALARAVNTPYAVLHRSTID